ncbi:amidohydrolase family protein [Sphingomonas sp. PB2P19]|uniref:amidohydrolase family protein n=1 Tax=Sphingomonas rhamnosi TaxID=3096156 RepID=UPI002FCAB4E1
MIDAHVHLWELARRQDAWPGPELPVLHRDFGLDDLRAALAGSGVRQVLLIQSEPSEADTRWLLQMAGDPIVAGVVGWTDLAAADAPARIDSLAAAGPLVGIRPMVQDLADEWYDDVALDVAFAHLAHRGLVLDALVRPRHLASLARLAARHPGLSIVIDHAAKPATGGDTVRWAEDMRALAALPNVMCKLSGLLTEIDRSTHADAVPRLIADLLTMFGLDRLIWGSDWPVVTMRTSYTDWLAQARDAIPSDRHTDVFARNAARTYRIPVMADAA